ncbi:MAG: apolipoprotein N-acyltransferase [Actinobacteria bacterium]|nr:apolipoprotein N-acyltransferase [Actinomycetota bacterium]
MRIRRALALALLGGIAVAMSLPPWGWWPLGLVGLAALYRALDRQPWRRRLLIGWVAGVGHFGISLFWFSEFTAPGAVVGILFSALYMGAADALTAPDGGWRRVASFPAALLLLEGLRARWPFGGVPIGGAALGQIAGPLGPAARIGGPLVLLGLAALLGAALAERGLRRRMAPALVAVAVVIVGLVGPAGRDTGRAIDVGLVQGGGRRGFRAGESDPEDVYHRHLAATERLRTDVDLLMWPEDVVDVDGDVARSTVAGELADVARRRDATFVVGVIEGEGTDHFRNAVVAWGADGRLVGRYEKVHRVPFGEWIPFRSVVGRIGDISAVPADAIVGRGPNVLRTPAGRLGVAISYEVFFADRARAASNGGAGVLLVPTNAASFTTTQVPTQEIAAARILAVASGRSVLQAGPTGYTAIVGHRGHVLARSVLSRPEVITGRVSLRSGRTFYARFGDWPWLLASLAALLTARSRVRKSRLAL